MSSKNYFIGLMSGTSLDAIDVAIVDIQPVNKIGCQDKISLVASHSVSLPKLIKSNLIHLSFEQNVNMQILGHTGVQLAHLFADAINDLMDKYKIDKSQVTAIGSHGLTIRHQPNDEFPFSMQITDANLLAQLTGIDVVSDFRNMDIAVGGQGAPLVPAFHQALFAQQFNTEAGEQHDDNSACILLNLGGIANITVLNPNAEVVGFDTGPANTLLDTWCEMHTQKPYDAQGMWAASGVVNHTLLDIMLEDNYFSLPWPKSTGKELFNIAWLNKQLELYTVKINEPAIKELLTQKDFQQLLPEDIQRTLLQLTVITAAEQIKTFTHTKKLFICGGGVHNQFLIAQLQQELPQYIIQATDSLGINSDALEAMAFAWLAYCRVNLMSANSPSVTGAQKKIVMGSWYSAKADKVIN
jgi:anhydro-N-acetylmuramic acid kinase